VTGPRRKIVWGGAAAVAIAWLALAPARSADAQATLVAQEATARAMLSTLRSVDASLQAVRLALRLPTPTGPRLPLPVDVNVRQMPSWDKCLLDPGKGNVAISQTASTKLVAGLPGTIVRICSVALVAGAAEIVSFTEGTGTTCGTGTLAVSGSTTAANGESFAANGGRAGGGFGTIMLTKTPGNDLCLAQSTTSRVAGNITFVQAP